ncbi:hypothetical protein BSKO_07068 [Bryopsis sp. KO-2023]|nr:hypothetical protein BSKO_07068 [Bryopsis sp. KO-2023]
MAPTPWKTTCLGLLGRPKYLVSSLCCPPIAFYSATEAIDPDNPADVCSSLCGGYICCYGYIVRRKLRKAFGLDGSDPGDLCVHCCCHCLALAHVWQEAEAWKEANLNQPPRPIYNTHDAAARPEPVIPYDPRMLLYPAGPGGMRGDHQVHTRPPPTEQIAPRPVENLESVQQPPSAAGPSGVVGNVVESEYSATATNASGDTGHTDEGDDRVIAAVGTGDVLKKYDTLGKMQKKEARRPLDSVAKMMITGSSDVSNVVEHPVKKLDPKTRFERLKERNALAGKPSSKIVGPQQSARTLDDMPLKPEEIEAQAQELAAADAEGSLGTRYVTEVRQPFDLRVGTNQLLRDSVNEDLDLLLGQTGGEKQRSSSAAPPGPGSNAEGPSSEIQATFSDPCLTRKAQQA